MPCRKSARASVRKDHGLGPFHLRIEKPLFPPLAPPPLQELKSCARHSGVTLAPCLQTFSNQIDQRQFVSSRVLFGAAEQGRLCPIVLLVPGRKNDGRAPARTQIGFLALLDVPVAGGLLKRRILDRFGYFVAHLSADLPLALDVRRAVPNLFQCLQEFVTVAFDLFGFARFVVQIPLAHDGGVLERVRPGAQLPRNALSQGLQICNFTFEI